MKAVVLALAVLLAQAYARELKTYYPPGHLALDTKFNVLIRCGDIRPHPEKKEMVTLGAQTDKHGRPVLDAAGADRLTGTPDYTSYLRTPEGIFSVVQMETSPAVYYAMGLEQNKEGHMRVNTLEAVDLSEWDGSVRPCAGSISPWNTHLGGEENYPDVRELTHWLKPTEDNLEEVAASSDVKNILNWHGYYLGSGNESADAALALSCERIGATYIAGDAAGKLQWHQLFTTIYKPYMIGHIVEITIKKGRPHFQKHLALGRSSFETGYVMPDEKTVYLTDDSSGGGLTKFIMDKKGDLSKGTMYAAKVKQLSADEAENPEFEITWIKMAHLDHEYLLKMARKPLTEFNFNHIFYVAELNADGTCPDDYKRVDWDGNTECLKLNTHTPNVEMLATGLETRRYIPYIGATSEYRKMEGLVHDEKRNRIYMAISYQEGAMTPGSEGQDDIRVKENQCGCVYGFELDKDYNIHRMYTQVCGKEITDGEGETTCSTDYPANPDNLSFMQGYDWLAISEDSDNRGQCFMVMHNVETKENIIVAAAEKTAEVAAGWYQDDLTKWDYVTMNFQGLPNSPIGYLGPFPEKELQAAKKVTWKPHVPMGPDYLNPYAPF